MSEHDNKPEPGWLDFSSPDLQALLLTYRHVGELRRTDAPSEHWDALARALVAEHTPEQLANMLLGSCAIHARSLDEVDPSAT